MKLLLSALCASFMIAPLSFASECEKGKCDKEKEEGTILAAGCDKCKKDGEADKDKEEGTLACGDKCKKEDGEAEKAEGTLADCGKCKKDGDAEKDKEEGALA